MSWGGGGALVLFAIVSLSPHRGDRGQKLGTGGTERGQGAKRGDRGWREGREKGYIIRKEHTL